MTAEQKDQTPVAKWVVVEYPGYLGKRKDAWTTHNNELYGEGNWQTGIELKDGRVLRDYMSVIGIYIEGYFEHFLKHPEEADFITSNFSYAYDKDMITKEQAFDPYVLYNKPGTVNQFHHVAFNYAIVLSGREFQGTTPLQVREGKPGTPESEQPTGWRWSPGHIPCPKRWWDLSIDLPSSIGWWQEGSIEHFYQKKALIVKEETLKGKSA